jgi:hypothetical protein
VVVSPDGTELYVTTGGTGDGTVEMIATGQPELLAASLLCWLRLVFEITNGTVCRPHN